MQLLYRVASPPSRSTPQQPNLTPPPERCSSPSRAADLAARTRPETAPAHSKPDKPRSTTQSVSPSVPSATRTNPALKQTGTHRSASAAPSHSAEHPEPVPAPAPEHPRADELPRAASSPYRSRRHPKSGIQ